MKIPDFTFFLLWTIAELKLIDKSLVLDFEKYLEKKKRKIGNASHGFDRGQHELITQLSKLRKLEKQYGVKWDYVYPKYETKTYGL